MLQYRRTFEDEKHQLQELNGRLGQYLSRTKQLEQENACLITEINKIRQEKTVEWENQSMAEMRELRRMVGQLSFEKSRAEMEREKLWQEFKMLQNMCCEESVVCKDIDGELKGCEKQLLQAQQTNGVLEERLFQLEHEYKFLDDAHRQEIAHLRSKVHSRVVVTQTYHGPAAATMEEVQEYARSLSEGWIDTFEMYRLRVDEMEESIKADQAKLDDLQREKMHYASEFDRMRSEVEKHSQIQIDLEEQIMRMQENFHGEFGQYQMIIDELEQERRLLADSMAEKLREHQELLQVKMSLGMEVASYRALLEGERIDVKDAHMWANQHGRERVIDIKMPSQPYTQRVSTSTRQDLRKHLDVRYMEPSLRRSPVPAQSGSRSPSRIIPISFTDRANQSPAARRDMISFTKASQAAAASSSVKTLPLIADKKNQDMQKTAVEERSVRIKEVSQNSVKEKFSPIASPTADTRSVRVVSPPMMSLGKSTEEDSKMKVRDANVNRRDINNTDMAMKNEKQVVTEERGRTFQSEKMVLDAVSMEEIIEKVMKPAALGGKISSSEGSKIKYHVEKTEQEDGTTKTQIILESKVEEELDMSEDSALEELLSKGVKTMSLEDIKGTPTGDMIQNLLSLGLPGGEDLGNKSVNVEIIEEPVEYEEEDEDEVEVKSKLSQPSSMFFQIEELENDPQGNKHYESQDEEMKTSMTAADHGRNGSVQVQEDSGNTDPYFTLDQDSQEYFVSTPDDNMSEPEDGGGIASYGHYGAVDDLSDERYYQEGGLQGNRMYVEESDSYRPAPDTKYMKDEHPYGRESFPECIIEEEVQVSPTVQESMLEFLREDSLDPKEQLRGALEQLQGTVSGTLKKELDLLTRAGSDSPQNFDIRNVHQSTDNGTMTITAELNVSQTLEESGMLEEQGDDLSEEQIMAALRSSNPGFQQAFQGGAEGGYTLRVSRDQDITGIDGFGGYTTTGESMTEVTEKHMKLGPSEKSFTFQMDVNNSQAQGSDTTERAQYGQVLQTQITDPPRKVTHEKRIATVYLESSEDE